MEGSIYRISILFVAHFAFPIGAQTTSTISGIRERTPSSSCSDLSHCRTTWNIVWSCLVTILTCTWVAIHPNISGSNEKWPTITLRRLRLMLIALIAPEMIIFFAMQERLAANRLKEKYRVYGWTLSHGFFAIMGGFTLVKDGQIFCTLDMRQGVSETPTLEDHLDQIDITEEDIKDRSKGDMLSKGLVIIQTGWFVVQCIARRVERIPITELEIVTVAFAVLNFLTYILWWHKPLNVKCPVRVAIKSDKGIGAPDGIREDLKIRMAFIRDAQIRRRDRGVFDTIIPSPFKWFLDMLLGRRNITAWDATLSETMMATFTAGVIATIFGAIHCLAWSFQFPSHTEQLLWRISSLVIACIPILLAVVTSTEHILQDSDFDFWWHPVVATIVFATNLVGVILYTIARLSLLVLAFMSLRSLSPGAYETVHWTTFIPHV